jgi:hypothetical protein
MSATADMFGLSMPASPSEAFPYPLTYHNWISRNGTIREQFALAVHTKVRTWDPMIKSLVLAMQYQMLRCKSCGLPHRALQASTAPMRIAAFGRQNRPIAGSARWLVSSLTKSTVVEPALDVRWSVTQVIAASRCD